jgi:Fe-S oxidoreductase
MRAKLVFAAEETRSYFYTLPLWLKVTFYVVALSTLVVFFGLVVRKWRRYRSGRKDPADRPSLRRFMAGVLSVFSHRRVLRDHPVTGLAHAAVFYGFAGLFVATLVVLVDADILHPLFPSLTYLHGSFYLVFSWLADLCGVLLIAGLAVLMFRRLVLRPPELRVDDRDDVEGFPSGRTVRLDDLAFLLLLLIAGIGGFFLEGLRIRATQPSWEGWSFTGWILSGWLGDAGVTAAGAETSYAYLWVFHAITAFVFVAYLPVSKAWHMLAGWYSLAIKPEVVGEFPGAVDTVSGGYDHMTDLSRGELAMLDACIRCGRCHAACPATSAGFPLSPRDLILSLRAGAARSLPLPRGAPGTAAAAPVLTDTLVPPEWLWACTTCLACDDICPLGIQHLPLILQMRRHLVAEGDIEAGVQDTLMNVMRYGNSFGTSPRARARWTRDLPFEVKDARKEPVEYLWFVGDYASFDPRTQDNTRAVARVLNAAGVDFGILYDSEQNAGADVRRIGEEGLFEMQREKNLEALADATYRKIVTTDPHSYHALRREYSDNGAAPVLHYTQLLVGLLDSGALTPLQSLGATVTYHDPCYLGRYNGVFEEPRRLLRGLGAQLVEMPRNRAGALCCGAGGGRIWMEDAPGITERPAESRVREAAALEGVDTLVVCCPKDLVMFQDAVKTTGLEGTLEVKDVIELVEEATRREATRRTEESTQGMDRSEQT